MLILCVLALFPRSLKHSLKRVDTLAARWLGKCHACHLGASTASGDWFLFTDADCWLKKEVIARAIAVAEWENVDHVTLTPVSRFRRFLPKRGISLS